MRFKNFAFLALVSVAISCIPVLVCDGITVRQRLNAKPKPKKRAVAAAPDFFYAPLCFYQVGEWEFNEVYNQGYPYVQSFIPVQCSQGQSSTGCQACGYYSFYQMQSGDPVWLWSKGVAAGTKCNTLDGYGYQAALGRYGTYLFYSAFASCGYTKQGVQNCTIEGNQIMANNAVYVTVNNWKIVTVEAVDRDVVNIVAVLEGQRKAAGGVQ